MGARTVPSANGCGENCAGTGWGRQTGNSPFKARTVHLWVSPNEGVLLAHYASQQVGAGVAHHPPAWSHRA